MAPPPRWERGGYGDPPRSVFGKFRCSTRTEVRCFPASAAVPWAWAPARLGRRVSVADVILVVIAVLAFINYGDFPAQT